MRNTILILILSFLGLAAARAQTPITFDGVDITPLVQDLKNTVQTLKKDITIYNWSTNGAHVDNGTKGLGEAWSQSFWQGFGIPNGNMYGYGLYGALDPVATYGYGFPSNGWLMTEITLPAGSAILDVVSGSFSGLSAASKQILLQFNCPTGRIPDELVQNGGSALHDKCKPLVKKIYKDLLSIDALAYSYSATSWKECMNDLQGMSAFVVTDAKKLKADSFRYYTANTKDKEEQRILIQTLFLKAGEVNINYLQSYIKQPLLDYLNKNPESELKSSTTKCEGEYCIITAQFCDSKNACVDVSLNPIQRGGGPLITQSEAKRRTPGMLIWSDLEGKPKATTVTTWLKDNRFACDGAPYVKKDQ